MDALVGLDLVLHTLERVADAAPRDYKFVVLSDHGQSQGSTFRQLTGRSLEDAVRDHLGTSPASVVAETGDVEGWGPLNALLTEVRSMFRPKLRRRPVTPVTPEPPAPEDDEKDEEEPPELVVVGSGNLGLVWFPRLPGRVTLETFSEQYPGLVPGLLDEPGVGFVVVDSVRGPLAVGPRGVRVLLEDVVEGVDPLLGFGPRAAGDLIRVCAMKVCPDLYVHSTLHPRTGEVHAFEELVGSHGGLGGWQNQAVLVHPVDWTVDEDLLDHSVPGEELFYGGEKLHQQLVRWLERIGARRLVDPLDIDQDEGIPADSPGLSTSGVQPGA
jgi:hypothetical protein